MKQFYNPQLPANKYKLGEKYIFLQGIKHPSINVMDIIEKAKKEKKIVLLLEGYTSESIISFTEDIKAKDFTEDFSTDISQKFTEDSADTVKSLTEQIYNLNQKEGIIIGFIGLEGQSTSAFTEDFNDANSFTEDVKTTNNCINILQTNGKFLVKFSDGSYALYSTNQTVEAVWYFNLAVEKLSKLHKITLKQK